MQKKATLKRMGMTSRKLARELNQIELAVKHIRVLVKILSEYELTNKVLMKTPLITPKDWHESGMGNVVKDLFGE